jgi:hypothetical protein
MTTEATQAQGMFTLEPAVISDAAYIASPVAEPDTTRLMGDGSTGEVAWVSGTDYPQNKRVIRTATHRVYRDTMGGVSSVAPEVDPVRWFDEGPTNKWAAFDALAGTQTAAASPAVFTVRPGVCTDAEFFGLSNVDTVRVQMWDEPGGNLVYDELFSTEEYPGADLHWPMYFEPPYQGNTLSVEGLPVWPGCEVTVTLSSYDAAALGIGLLAFGSYQYLGMAQFGFRAVYRDYGYTTTDKWGNSTRTAGAKGKDLRGDAVLDLFEANGLDATLRRLLDVGAIYVPARQPEYRFLKTWGRLKPADITAAGPTHALVSYEIEGNI